MICALSALGGASVGETRFEISFDTPCYMEEVLILSSQGVGWTLLLDNCVSKMSQPKPIP